MLACARRHIELLALLLLNQGTWSDATIHMLEEVLVLIPAASANIRCSSLLHKSLFLLSCAHELLLLLLCAKLLACGQLNVLLGKAGSKSLLASFHVLKLGAATKNLMLHLLRDAIIICFSAIVLVAALLILLQIHNRDSA